MITVQSDAYKAVKRMEVRQRSVAQLKNFFNKKKQSYWAQAYSALYREVYVEHGQPKRYQRTYNTLRSLDAETFTGVKSAGLTIFLNPQKADIEVDLYQQLTRGTLPIYPSYVLLGIWTKAYGRSWAPDDPSPRNFLKRWVQRVGQRYIKEFKQEFKNAIEVK